LALSREYGFEFPVSCRAAGERRPVARWEDVRILDGQLLVEYGNGER